MDTNGREKKKGDSFLRPISTVTLGILLLAKFLKSLGDLTRRQNWISGHLRLAFF
jgi:hypothetical protein